LRPGVTGFGEKGFVVEGIRLMEGSLSRRRFAGMLDEGV